MWRDSVQASTLLNCYLLLYQSTEWLPSLSPSVVLDPGRLQGARGGSWSGRPSPEGRCRRKEPRRHTSRHPHTRLCLAPQRLRLRAATTNHCKWEVPLSTVTVHVDLSTEKKSLHFNELIFHVTLFSYSGRRSHLYLKATGNVHLLICFLNRNPLGLFFSNTNIKASPFKMLFSNTSH